MIKIIKQVTAVSTNASLTFNMVDVPEGSFLMAIVRNQSTGSLSDFTPPTGWTRRGPEFMPSNAGARVTSAWTKFGSGVVDATFKINGVSSGRTLGVLIAFSGVDPNTPVIGESDNYTGNSIGGQFNDIGGGIYTFDIQPVRDALQLTYGVNELVSPNEISSIRFSAGSIKELVAQTPGDSTVTRTILALISNEIPKNSRTTPLSNTFIGWPSVSGATAHSITLMASPEPPQPLTLNTADGRIAKIYSWDGSKTHPVSSLNKVHKGFSSVSQMLSTPGFTWAHRGGSANWAEMSLHAYTQSLIAGYGALELSLARTSDGVWFGFHDEDMTRVTSGASTSKPRDMTWTQVQQLSITNGNDQIHRPFMHIDEYINAYARDCVTILDLKYEIRTPALIDEFFRLCERFPEDQLVIKSFYNGTVISNKAKTLGLASWGYAYPEDMVNDPEFFNRASTWTLLGMTHSASQDVWNQILSVGKPVVGHIAATQEAYNSAMSKGAVGVQCSNVLGIKAVGAI